MASAVRRRMPLRNWPSPAAQVRRLPASGRDDLGAVAKLPCAVVHRYRIERLFQGRRRAQRHLRAAGNVAGQPAADIAAIAGVRRTAIALVDDDGAIGLSSLARPLRTLSYLEDNSSLNRALGDGAHGVLDLPPAAGRGRCAGGFFRQPAIASGCRSCARLRRGISPPRRRRRRR